ncbi:MAG: N,N-dimethylformamidase [Gammaproteobacteria bacterium]|nr:N,N-dimethylformamidase [Gammaproteobacteria bacterium]
MNRFNKNIVSYVDPLSVQAGDELKVMVSCHESGDFRACLVRLVSGDSRPHGTGFHEVPIGSTFAGDYPGREQFIHAGSYAVLPDLPSLDSGTFCCRFYPTTPKRPAQTLVSASGLVIGIEDACLVLRMHGVVVRSGLRLQASRWHDVIVAFGADEALLSVQRHGEGPAERGETVVDRATIGAGTVAAGDWLLAAVRAEDEIVAGLNGRIEAPRVLDQSLSIEAAAQLLVEPAPQHPGLLGSWDFSRELSSDRLVDTSGYARHGHTLQTPTRAVKGARWNGATQNWRDDPGQYGAVHFHEDDLTDAGWSVDIRWQVPDDLPSGVYAIKLTLGDSEDYSPLFVRPAAGQLKQSIVFLAATATYLAYANQRLGSSRSVFGGREPRNANDAYLLAHDEVGDSLYEYHADRSGVHYSSRLRPILNLKPHNIPWSFTADTNITAWLEAIGEPFDVVTDEDLHREGVDLLRDYRVVITGTHPEYYSTSMLDGLGDWLDSGGRLMYMGGNGFYWRIAYDPDNPAIIEVRRAEDGTRAWISDPGEYYHSFTGEYGGLWRRLGRPPNQLVGVGFAAQGFDGGTHYRVRPDALDDRVAFIFKGIETDFIGAHGTQGGGAAGEEVDRFDVALGSPVHALVLARSEDHKPGMLKTKEEFHVTQPQTADADVRADLTFFETPAGGAVFSTGSISFAGALSTNGYDNDIAVLMRNVLSRFDDPEPFVFPTFRAPSNP